MKTYLLCFFLISILGAEARPGTGKPGTPIIPMKPAELITYMPGAPTGWSLTRSVAANDFNNWISTYAERCFKQDPPPLAPGVTPPPFIPGLIRIHATDTGYNDDLGPMVTPSKSGATPTGVSYLEISDSPARLQKVDEKTWILCIAVKKRFLVEIQSKNLTDEQMKAFSKAFDFKKLLAATDVGETGLPWPAFLSRIDELQPKNNSTYPVYWQRATDPK